MRVHREMVEAASVTGLLGTSSLQSPSVVKHEFLGVKECCYIKKEDALAKVKAVAEKMSDVLYIYYTGHTDLEGSWCLEGSERVKCQEVMQVLSDSKFSGKLFIVIDGCMGGRWVRSCQELF